MHVTIALRWEAIIQVCQNLQFGAYFYDCMVVCCSMYGVGLGWLSYLVGWVGSGSMIWTHGQLCDQEPRQRGRGKYDCPPLVCKLVVSSNKKAQLMLAYPRDAKTMKKIPPFRSYNKFQSSRKSGVYSN